MTGNSLFYLATFGIPLLLYVVWLARFTKRMRFSFLLVFAVFAVWLSLWPIYFGPEHQVAAGEIGDRSDTVVNGFVLGGWFNGLIGCLPIILVEIPRSIVLLMRRRKKSKSLKFET